MKSIFAALLVVISLSSCNNTNQTNNTEEETKPKEQNTSKLAVQNKSEVNIDVKPISHASFVLQLDSLKLFIDPVSAEDFKPYGQPHYILVTDIHGDHFSTETLEAMPGEFSIIAPQAVYDQLSENLKSKTLVLNNRQSEQLQTAFNLKALPMYNITEGRLDKHPKGRGNAYVINYHDNKIYISGDTEDIKEMRALENIDMAFICMNLPYTMDLNQAADAVLEFKPKKVIPYHYRGVKDGKAYYEDVEEFKSIVTSNDASIEVELLDWYDM
ncbi:MBL fold metallo-hydrolase [Psychroflexus sp. ALD_RP9]|uniref:MBL fold metallo-hydrolase n=1 Tax=Psychroflexus sp. ALD_RP9 TaxID=2777186 RepID=UPI001A9052FA|nr:MBL fold metallo-hydrolase [Psychroflexus sp. ALD_RP9]QSS97107.1 MBL fold metallo-hydrolase [Psychroflexus sp. ALD_RP9]